MRLSACGTCKQVSGGARPGENWLNCTAIQKQRVGLLLLHNAILEKVAHKAGHKS